MSWAELGALLLVEKLLGPAVTSIIDASLFDHSKAMLAAIAEAGAIPHLVALLRSAPVAASQALLGLCSEPEHREALLAAGAVPPCVRTFRELAEGAAHELAFWLLLALGKLTCGRRLLPKSAGPTYQAGHVVVRWAPSPSLRR